MTEMISCAAMGRPPSCLCGVCSKCKRREKDRERYQALSAEERRAIVARRDPEAVRRRQREMYERDPEFFRRKARRAYDRDKEGWNRRAREWRQANPEKTVEMARRWREENREKRRAHHAVQTAIRNGTLVRPDSCLSEGCDRPPHAHHADYSKPLEVEWLCARHHYELHREQRGLER